MKNIRILMIFCVVILTAGFASGVLYAADHNVTLTWEPQNPIVNEPITYTVSAPGADKVRFFWEGTYETYDGDYISKYLQIGRTTVEVTASALYDDVWTPMLPKQRINFSVAGRLAKVNAVVPSSIALSSSLPVSFPKIANAEYYVYCIYPEGLYCQQSQKISAEDYSGQTISKTIDETKNLTAGEYIFEIYGRASGYISQVAHYIFNIVDSSQSLPPAPIVSIGKNQYYLYSRETLDLTISANGATQLRYLQSGPNDARVEDSMNSDNTIPASHFYPVGDYSLQFSAMINGKWSAYSDPVRFTIVSFGTVPAVNFSIPEIVESGDILSVSIDPIENVERYYVDIWQVYENGRKQYTNKSVSAADLPVYIYMDNAEAGIYSVRVYGYRGGYESINTYQFFTVTGSVFSLPDNLTVISDYAFANAGMTSVVIPKTVQTISPNAFKGCPNLTKVSISNGTTSIGENAFANNPKLINVIIPSSVSSIADTAFSNCSILTTITVAQANTYAANWATSHGFSVAYY